MSATPFKLAPVALAAVMSVGATATPSVAAQETSTTASAEASYSFSLPAQPLGDALNALARQAGLQLLVRRELVEGKQAPAVDGSLTARQALDRVLAGSGLVAATQGSNVVVRASPSPEGSRSEVTLPTVRVTAPGEILTPSQGKERGYRVERSNATGFDDRPVLDTPFSVTAVTSELIADQQAQSLMDVVRNAPSVTLQFPTFDDSVSIRGFDTSIAHRDGFPITRQVRVPLENKASVDFLYGMNGFRYGVNSPGGVVSYSVKRPTLGPLTSLKFSTDSNGSVGTHLDLSRRFGRDDQFGLRVNAAAERFKSFIDNVEGPRRLLSVFADWRATPDLTLELDLESFHDKRPAIDFGLAAFASLDDARAILPRIQPHMSLAQPWQVEDRDRQIASARANYQLAPEWKATFALMKSDAFVPYAGVAAQNIRPNGDYTLRTWYSPNGKRDSEALLASVNGAFTLGGMKNELVVALTMDKQYLDSGGTADLTLGTANLFRSEVIANSIPVPLVMTNPRFALEEKRRSLVANNIVHLNDRWQLLTGLSFNQLSARNPDTGVESYDESAVSPTLAVVHKFHPTTSVYASYATALEQGGMPGPPAINPQVPMPPLRSKQFELGIKKEFGPGALGTLSLFKMDKSLEYINSQNLYVQDGRQVHHGIEATLSGQLSRQFRIMAGLTYLKAEVAEAAENLGSFPAGTPKLQASVWGDWHLPLVAEGFHLNGGIHAASSKYVNMANTFSVPGYAVSSVGARYRHVVSNQIVTYRINVDNLFDRRYFISAGAYDGIYFGPSRTVSASVSIDF